MRSLAVFVLGALVMFAAGCWPEPDPLPPEEENTTAYGPCSDAWGRILCLEIENICVDDGVNGAPALNFACGATCESVDDCPAAPESGEAIVTCDEVDTCVLSCAGDLACPDGMSCILDVCLNPTP
jgi:hypothetical protein